MAVKFIPVDKQQDTHPLPSHRTLKKDSQGFKSVFAQTQKVKGQSVPVGGSYTIRPGDTLYSISKRLKENYNLPQSSTQIVRYLTAMNKLSNPNLINAGQTLRIPLPLKETDAVESAPKAGPPDTASDTPHRTIVQRNNEAEKFGIPFSLADRKGFVEKASFSTAKGANDTPAVADDRGPVLAAPAKPAAGTSGDLTTQIATYKEDQLLAHPGGDYYFLNRTNNVYDPAFDQSNFANRVGKDLSDAGENLLNIVRDLAMGSEFKYVAKDGTIEEGKRVGLMGTLKNFFEDLLSGLSFGAYMPADEKAPVGVGESIWHFFKKVFYDAPVKDLLVGVPHAGMNVVKNAAFAVINTLEVVPDATIGNFNWGQKLTTTIFDNGQVVVDYLTDVIPGGNAWLRVHAAGANGELSFPVLYNLNTPEQGITDSRWATVRNTPFRKTIEIVGSLLSDAFAVMSITSPLTSSSADHKRP